MKVDNVKKTDERIQRYPDTDEGRISKAVNKPSLADEPKAFEEAGSEQEPEPEEIDSEKWYILKVPVSGKMLIRMQEIGPKLGYVDEAEVFRDGLRRVLWGK